MKKSPPLILKPEDSFDAAAKVCREGGIIAYPTETFYGLGVDPFSEKALKKLFSLKGRPSGRPISIIIKDRAMLEGVVEEIPPVAEGLMKKFWPGPLTIVFTAKKNVPDALTAGTGKIGVRISSGAVAQKLMDSLGSPLTATSANPSGRQPAGSADEVIGYFDGDIGVLIDGGKLAGRLGSTVVDATGNKIEIIREGEISLKEIL